MLFATVETWLTGMIDKSATILKVVPLKLNQNRLCIYRLQAKDLLAEDIEESIICIYLYYFYDRILSEFVYSIWNILWL